MIWKIMTLAYFFYNAADGGIMNMTDSWKEMMLYLVVQAPDKPGYKLMPWRKI